MSTPLAPGKALDDMHAEEGAWVDLGPDDKGGAKAGPVWRNISRSMARIMRHQGVCDSFEDGRIYHKTLMKLLIKDYRWLEDVDAPETRAWVEAQNRVTSGWLDALPHREALKRRLTALWDYARYGVPFKRGGRRGLEGAKAGIASSYERNTVIDIGGQENNE